MNPTRDRPAGGAETTAATGMLQLRHLSVARAGRDVVHGVDIEIRRPSGTTARATCLIFSGRRPAMFPGAQQGVRAGPRTVRRRAADAGARANADHPPGGPRQLFLTDPDGVLVEINVKPAR
jgi:hypothetical protein